MKDLDQERADRARARRVSWSVQRCPPGAGEPVGTVLADALAGMWQLTVDSWVLSGRIWPSYSREEMPGRVLRPVSGG